MDGRGERSDTVLEAALSALGWWADAGVDMLVEEAPRDWLARAAPAMAAAAPAPAIPAAPALPADLAAFRRWLLTDAAVPGPARARHDAVGDPATGTAVLLDMPEVEDRGTAQLLTGEAGALFDRMLAAIGLDRGAIYLLPFAPARPASGKLPKDDCATLHRLALHHLALAAPRRLLLLGDAPTCSLLDQPVTQSRGRVHQLDVGGRAVPTVCSFPPRLVRGADVRRKAWDDLQRFRELA